MKATPRNILRINSVTAGNQQNPSIAIDNSGNFVIAWQGEGFENGQDIFARFYSKRGSPYAPEIFLNTLQSGEQTRPAIAVDSSSNSSNNRLLTVWQNQLQNQRNSDSSENSDSSIIAQLYSFNTNPAPNTSPATQIGSGFPINFISGVQQRNPDVAFNLPPATQTQNSATPAPVPGYVVAWQAKGSTTNDVIGRDDSGFGIFAQRYNINSTPVGKPFLVNTILTDRDQTNPAVAVDDEGNFVVVWQSRTSNGFDIFGQRYNKDGTANGTEFQVNFFVAGDQINPDVAIDPDGNFVVTWQNNNGDGDGSGIYARRYNSLGNPVGAANLRVNSVTEGDQETPSIASDKDGNFTIVWASDKGGNSDSGEDSDSGDNSDSDNDFDIKGQQFTPRGKRIDQEFLVNKNTKNNQTRPEIAMQQSGNFVVTWQSEEGGARGTDILARRFTMPQANNGGNGGKGGNGSNLNPRPSRSLSRTASVSGQSNSNESVSSLIVGTAGDDLLGGGVGNDTMHGKQGRDGFVIGRGLGTETILDFQPGVDRLVLSGNLDFEDLSFVWQGQNTVVEADDRSLAVLRGVQLSLPVSPNLTSDRPFL